MKEWLGVDLDGTLAKYDGWKGLTHIGDPIPEMVAKVKKVLADGHEVRIFTARCYPIVEVVTFATVTVEFVERYTKVVNGPEALISVSRILEWSLDVFGQGLPVTCVKDYGMSELWDDRAIHVVPNTGILSVPSRRGYV